MSLRDMTGAIISRDHSSIQTQSYILSDMGVGKKHLGANEPIRVPFTFQGKFDLLLTYVNKNTNSHLGRYCAPDVFPLFYIGLANVKSNFSPQVNGTLSGSLAPNTRMLTHTGVRCRRTFSSFSRNDIPCYFGVTACFCSEIKETRTEIWRRSVQVSRRNVCSGPIW